MLRSISPTIYRFDSLHSTNDTLKEMKENGLAKEGIVVMTKDQKKGRGVSGSWESNQGENLTFSVYLEPSFLKIEESHYINFLVGYSLHQYVSLHLEDVSIKWPNDILVSKEKIAGVLIENSFEGKRVKNTIIGIGLNINQSSFNDFSRKATSLKQKTEVNYDLEFELNSFLKILSDNYSSFEFSKEKFKSWYHQHLYLKDVKSRYMVDSKEIQATNKGVDAYGRIILEIHDTSELRCYDLKEIKFLD